MLCCSHLLLLATRQLFVLAKTLFWALIVTTHLFVMDVQFLAFVSMGHDTYSAGAILLWAIHVPGYAVHHYVCLLHPCGVIEFYGPYVYVVLFCCCVVQGHQFFGYCFMYARSTTVLPSSKRSFALLFLVYTHNTP